MRALAVLALSLALAAPALTAEAQGRQVRRLPGGPAGPLVTLFAAVEGDPVGIMLERADSLGLTDDQTERLRALRREARRANRTISDSLERMGIERPDAGMPVREFTKEQTDAVRPLEDAARENNRLARDSALVLLTQPQRERFLGWERARRGGASTLPEDTMPVRRPPPGGRFSR